MEILECIKTRRSVRRFIDKDISEDTIKRIQNCEKNVQYFVKRYKKNELLLLFSKSNA